MNLEEAIAAAAAEKSITLTPAQIEIAVRELNADIKAHERRIAAWVAAGVEISADAAELKINAKARAAVRAALRNS